MALGIRPHPAFHNVDTHQEAEERHRQALWADEGTNGASFMEEKEDEERGGVLGNEEMNYPAWRLVLRRLVDHHKFQVLVLLSRCTPIANTHRG